MAGDVGRDATVLATRVDLCGRVATWFGDTTVMPGSWAAEPVAVCDTAVPLWPHSNAVDKMAIAEGATKLDDNLMPSASSSEAGKPRKKMTRAASRTRRPALSIKVLQ